MIEARHLGRPARAPFDGRAELGRFLALVGATGIALAQPLLDALGRSPETFVYHRVEGTDLALFALGLVLVPPLVLWGIGLLVGVVVPRWRSFVHGASIGLLVSIALLQALRSQNRLFALVLAIGLGLGAWLLAVGSKGFRMWNQYLAVVAPLTLISFLALSPSSGLVGSQSFEAASSGGDAPVVLIILDEFPTASILTPDGGIDPVRFPNLARLAGESTWYRNHTATHGFTTVEVPTIMDGRMPADVAPLLSDHPDNIFRALAGSHDMVVSEALTRLCPVSVCGTEPTPPGSGGVERESADLSGLMGDSLDLLWGRMTGRQGVALDGFEERANSVAGEFDGGDDTHDPLEVFTKTSVNSQPARVTSFLEALKPAHRPIAAVIHIVSPHWPWVHLPDGETYAEPADGADLPIDGDGNPWVTELERQRHLLQASYTDGLVGAILDRVRAEGWYDDAAVVVTADHGISFHGDRDRRLPVEKALPEIMWTPLLIKAPGQTEGRVDDSNAQAIDVMPTIAHLAGAQLPWSVDGLVLGSKEQLARGSTKPFRRIKSGADAFPSKDLEVDGQALFPQVLGLAPPPAVAEEEPATVMARQIGQSDLIGQPLAATGDAPADLIKVDGLDDQLRAKERVVVLSGLVDGEIGTDYVVAAVDGRIVSLSPVIHRNLGGAAFALLLPVYGPPVDVSRLQLALVHGGERLTTGPLGA